MFINKRNALTKQTGSLLIELMLGMSLSLLLIVFLLEIYFTSQKSYRLQTALHQIQEHAKTTIRILKSDLHAAGYIGCAHLDEHFIIKPYSHYSLSARNQLQGTNTEIITRHAAATAVMLQRPIQQTDVLYASKEIRFAPEDILIITDCKQGEIFQVKKIKQTRDLQIIIADHPLQNQYEPNAEISQLEENKYFIAATNRKNSDGSLIQALYIEDIKHRRMELVEGIESMAMTYFFAEMKTKKVDSSPLAAIMINLFFATPPIKKNWYLYTHYTSKSEV